MTHAWDQTISIATALNQKSNTRISKPRSWDPNTHGLPLAIVSLVGRLGAGTTLTALAGGLDTLLTDLDAGKLAKAEALQEGGSLGINLNRVELEGRLGGHIVVLALALLLLQLEGDAAHGPLLDAAHQMGGEAGNLVAQALVRLEIQSEARIVFLNEQAGGLLDGLGAYTTLNTTISCHSGERKRDLGMDGRHPRGFSYGSEALPSCLEGALARPAEANQRLGHTGTEGGGSYIGRGARRMEYFIHGSDRHVLCCILSPPIHRRG